jgi:hypothetical protein
VACNSRKKKKKHSFVKCGCKLSKRENRNKLGMVSWDRQEGVCLADSTGFCMLFVLSNEYVLFLQGRKACF